MQQHEMFVGRQPQIDKFEDILSRIERQAPVNSNLLEHHGVARIGKTSLFREFEKIGDQRQRAYQSVINFSEYDVKELEIDPTVLIQCIAQNLGVNNREMCDLSQSFRDMPQPKLGVVQAYKKMDQETRLYQRPDWLNGVRNVVISFIRNVNEVNGRGRVKPVVVLFDETKQASVDLIDWAEEWVINPILQVRHVVVGWSTNRPWRWKRPESRRKLTSEVLGCLEKREVEELVRANWQGVLTQAIIGDIYKTTGGHPAYVWAALNK